MWILVVEALGALALLLFIVWWTLAPAQRRERDALRALERERLQRQRPGTERPERHESGPGRAVATSSRDSSDGTSDTR